MLPLTAIVSAIIAAAGWFYLFYSRAAAHLAGLEQERLNGRRVWLRKIGGGLMLGLAIGFFAGFNTVTASSQPRAFIGVWLTVCGLLTGLVVLALMDLRLTWLLRKNLMKTKSKSDGGRE